MSEDSSPYHNFSSKVPADSILNNWQKYLSNNTPVSMLSIPGAHDAGTYSCGKVSCCQCCFSSQCQIWSVYDQLQLGIRFLDLRIMMKDDVPFLKHGMICFESLDCIL